MLVIMMVVVVLRSLFTNGEIREIINPYGKTLLCLKLQDISNGIFTWIQVLNK